MDYNDETKQHTLSYNFRFPLFDDKVEWLKNKNGTYKLDSFGRRYKLTEGKTEMTNPFTLSYLLYRGILNNLPGDILKDHFEGKLITVYTSPNKHKIDLKKTLFKKKYIQQKSYQNIHQPHLGEILVRYVFTNSYLKKEKIKKMSSLHLEPPPLIIIKCLIINQ